MRAAQGTGLALGVGALGLISFVLFDRDWVGAEALLLLIVTTVVCFAVFGAVLGRREDQLLSRAAELDRLSVTDPLTGLKNVRYFWTRVSEAYANAERACDPLSLLLIDVDDFKQVNDRHGHPAGDRVLRSLAEAIERVARAGDTVARVGGEEFALILPACDRAGATRVAERLLAESRIHGDAEIPITVSIGVASTSNLGFVGQHALYERADLALLDAKRNGKDRLALADRHGSESEHRARR